MLNLKERIRNIFCLDYLPRDYLMFGNKGYVSRQKTRPSLNEIAKLASSKDFRDYAQTLIDKL